MLKTRLSNLTDPSRGEIERLVRMLSPSERVIWRSLKGRVPIGLRRAFEESAAAEARAEEFSNYHKPAAQPPKE